MGTGMLVTELNEKTTTDEKLLHYLYRYRQSVGGITNLNDLYLKGNILEQEVTDLVDRGILSYTVDGYLKIEYLPIHTRVL